MAESRRKDPAHAERGGARAGGMVHLGVFLPAPRRRGQDVRSGRLGFQPANRPRSVRIHHNESKALLSRLNRHRQKDCYPMSNRLPQRGATG